MSEIRKQIQRLLNRYNPRHQRRMAELWCDQAVRRAGECDGLRHQNKIYNVAVATFLNNSQGAAFKEGTAVIMCDAEDYYRLAQSLPTTQEKPNEEAATDSNVVPISVSEPDASGVSGS